MKIAVSRDTLMDPQAGYRYSFHGTPIKPELADAYHGTVAAGSTSDSVWVSYLDTFNTVLVDQQFPHFQNLPWVNSLDVVRILLRRRAARTGPFHFCAKDYDAEVEACSLVTKALVLGKGIAWIEHEGVPEETSERRGDWDEWFDELDTANEGSKVVAVVETSVSDQQSPANQRDRSSPRLRIFSLSDISYSGNRWRQTK